MLSLAIQICLSLASMPLWSVEEWRVRIGSSWAALGRLGCSSHKERRHYVCCLTTPGGGGGGRMVMSLDRTIPMMTIVTLLMLAMSLTILLPLEAGCSPTPHSELYMLLRYLVIVENCISSKEVAL